MDGSSMDGDPDTVPARRQVFRNVVVVPRPSGERRFHGGPIWPLFRLRVRARTCWGRIPIPIDSKPRRPAAIEAELPAGIWCGEADPHYGHMVADFGMRMAYAGHSAPTLPLIFITRPAPKSAPPAFFWDLIDHFRVARARVLLVDRPTRFGELHVFPQAERRGGGGPSPAHLAFLERVTGDRSARPPDLGAVYVGRSKYKTGSLAGEGYLEQALRKAGVTVIDPGAMPLAAQIETYTRARLLIFSDGSAVHTLQLVGRVPGTIAVLVRRPRHRIAAASLKPRARSLVYLRALDRMIPNPFLATWYGRRDRGIALLDEARLLRLFAGLGIDLRAGWDGGAHRAARDADLALWVEHNRTRYGQSGKLGALEDRVRTVLERAPSTRPGVRESVRKAFLNL